MSNLVHTYEFFDLGQIEDRLRAMIIFRIDVDCLSVTEEAERLIFQPIPRDIYTQAVCFPARDSNLFSCAIATSCSFSSALDLLKILDCFSIYFVEFRQFYGMAPNFMMVGQVLAEVLCSDKKNIVVMIMGPNSQGVSWI